MAELVDWYVALGTTHLGTLARWVASIALVGYLLWFARVSRRDRVREEGRGE